jgi:hypothetical protein
MPLPLHVLLSLLATITVSCSGFVTPIIVVNPTPGSTPTSRQTPDLVSMSHRHSRLSRQSTQQQVQRSTTKSTSTGEADGNLRQRVPPRPRPKRRKVPSAKVPNQNRLPLQPQRQPHQPESQLVDWNDAYEQLRTFYERYEHLRLPRITSTQKALHDWVQTQARQPDTLTDAQLTKLVELGVWTEQLHAQPWEHWYLQLLHFYIHHGHSNVPCSSTTYLLAQWAYCQRNSSFQTHRQKKLLWSINFLWDSQQADFEIHYQRLLDVQQQQQQQRHTSKSIGSVRQWKKMQTAARERPTGTTTQPTITKTTNSIMNTTTATTSATAAAAAVTRAFSDETIWQLDLPTLFSPTYHEHHCLQDQHSQNCDLFAQQRRTARTTRS